MAPYGAYKQILNRVNSLNIQLKLEYFSEKIMEYQGELKKTWKTIDQSINKWSNTTVVPCLTVEGQTVTSNRAIAASINEYFCNIGNKLSEKIPEQRTPSCVVNTLDTPLPFLIPIGFCFGRICHNLLI